MDQKIVIVLGTRPEIIKLAPVACELEERGIEFEIVDTGQHYDDSMSASLLRAFSLEPGKILGLGGTHRGVQIGQMTEALTEHFLGFDGGVVVVQGDTNSALAGALAANACGKKLVHVEAGLRSYDRAMPEEHNRVLIDHLADLLCAPTSHNVKQLKAENIQTQIAVTGNTETDAIELLTPIYEECATFARGMGFEAGNFALSTIHRPENVDDYAQLSHIVEALNASELPVLLPAHPRTTKALSESGLSSEINPEVVTICDPLPVEQLWRLMKVCSIVISDSGGLQEDVTVFGKPMIIVRNSTERPESLGTFSKLVKAGPDLVGEVRFHTKNAATWEAELKELSSPYMLASGETSRAAIVDQIENAFDRTETPKRRKSDVNEIARAHSHP